MANRQSAKNKIHFENMQNTLQEPVTASPPLAKEADLFQKYRRGLVSPSAPFKLFELASMHALVCQDSSKDEEEHRVRGPYRKYSFQEKMDAVQCIQNGQDINLVSKKYGIPRRNLLRWRKNGCERKQGGGRPTDEEMQATISKKIKQGELTDEKQIRKLAVSLSKVQNFKASKGWFVKFCQRYDVRLAGESVVVQADFQSTYSHLI